MSYTVPAILEKITNSDADLRIVATGDLKKGLENGNIRLDGDQTRKVCKALMDRLEVDINKMVQENVYGCIKELVTKINEGNIEEMADALCNSVITGKEDRRSVVSIGLKYLVKEMPTTRVGPQVVRKLTPRLIAGISNPNIDIANECMELTSDLASRFGSLMSSDDHTAMMSGLKPQLLSSKPAVRRRAKDCLGFLAPSLSEALFADLVGFLVQNADSTQADQQRSSIQAIGAVSRQCGSRIGPFLGTIVPLFNKICTTIHGEEEQEDWMFDLLENIIQVFDTFVMRCPREVATHIEGIQTTALRFAKYDPFLADSEDEDEADEDDADEDEDEDEDEYSDDDDDDDEDTSYKVRRAAAKCLKSLINSRSDLLNAYYGSVAEPLLRRFKERLEPVKLDVFAAFIALIRQTAVVNKAYRSQSSSQSAMDVDAGPSVTMRQSESIEALTALVPKLVSKVAKQLNDKRKKAGKSRIGAFKVLSELISTIPGAFSADSISKLIPGVLRAVSDKGVAATLKLEALQFLSATLASHPASSVQPHTSAILKVVLSSEGVGDRYFKVSAQALRVVSSMVNIISEPGYDAAPHAQSIYTAVFERFNVQDIDQEVKESAIQCMGNIVARLGGSVDVPAVLPIFLDRLNNETTRIPAVRALGMCAAVDLSSIIAPATAHLLDFTRKKATALRQATLATLTELASSSNAAQMGDIDNMVAALEPMIQDSDLFETHLCLKLCVAIVENSPAAIPRIQSVFLPKVFELLQSPLLQGTALKSICGLFVALVKAGVDFGLLLKSVCDIVSNYGDSLSRQALSAIAQTTGALCISTAEAQCIATVSAFVEDIANKTVGDVQRGFALLAVGEAGRAKALQIDGLDNIIMETFMSPSEDVKAAASYCLGCICAGSPQKYFPTVMSELGSHEKKYLLLQAVKEVITQATASPEMVQPYMATLAPLLLGLAASGEEGVRNMAGECLGKLALVKPGDIVPLILDNVTNSDANVRTTIVTAVKFAVTGASAECDALLGPQTPRFLAALKDENLAVRRAALLTVNTMIRNKPDFVAESLSGDSETNLLGIIYGETTVKPSLIRTVQVGPFKHKVDDGLELRIAAFECLDTALDVCIDKVEPHSFVTSLASFNEQNKAVGGLTDEIDVKMICQLLLIKAADIFPAAVIAGMDAICSGFADTIKTKPKASDVPTEVQRNEDCLKSVFRAVLILRGLDPDSQRLRELIQGVESDERVKGKFAAVVEEHQANSTRD